MNTRFKSSLFARIFATTAVVISVLFAIMNLLAVPFIQTTVDGSEESAGRTTGSLVRTSVVPVIWWLVMAVRCPCN